MLGLPPFKCPGASCAVLGRALWGPVLGGGVPSGLINVGKALGDLYWRGAQYMQIRVIIITHNYGLSAGEIMRKQMVAGPGQGLAKLCFSIAVGSIFLPSFPPFPLSFSSSLPASSFPPSSGLVTSFATTNAFSRKEAT